MKIHITKIILIPLKKKNLGDLDMSAIKASYKGVVISIVWYLA